MKTAALALLALVLASSTSIADQSKKKKNKDKNLVDISKFDMRIVHDGDGHYVAFGVNGTKSRFFYGDGKHFYLMTGFTIGTATRKKGRFGALDPRVRSAEFAYDRTGASVTCRRGAQYNLASENTKLRDLSEKETVAILKKARFRQPVKRRKPHLLARDALGIYYYVDRLDEPDLRGFRLFVGEAGKMRKMPLKNIATDTVGQVFATKQGALQVRRVKSGLEAHAWVQPNRRDRFELVPVPTTANGDLIYNTLGVYGTLRLGTYCDDL